MTRAVLRVITANKATCGDCQYLHTVVTGGVNDEWSCDLFSEVYLGLKGAQKTPNRPNECLQAQYRTPDDELVVVPKAELMALLGFASLMLANEASSGRKRPSEDYSAVWGGDNEVFLGYHEELELQEMERLEKAKDG